MKITKLYIPIIILIIILISGYIYFAEQDQDFAKTIILEKSRFEYSPPENITQDLAVNYLLDAEEDIKEMKYSNISTYFVDDALLKAKRSFVGNDITSLKVYINKQESSTKSKYLESFVRIIKETNAYDVEKLNYSEVIRLCQLIDFRKKQAYDIIDTLSLVEEKERLYRSNNIVAYSVIEMISQAKKSFSEERYDEAEDYLDQANTELDRSYSEVVRVKDILSLSQGFFKRYYWQTILVLLIILLLIPPTIKTIKKNIIKRKIDNLEMELKTLQKLLIKAQKNRYKDNTISESTYRLMSEKYKSKIAEIKRNMPVFKGLISYKR